MFTKFIVSITVAAVFTAVATSASAEPPQSFDVAEDQTSFVFFPIDEGLNHQAADVHFHQFATQGYIYPAGTLADGFSGVTEQGHPAYPDKVIGTWSSNGWNVANGMQATTGMWQITRQKFEFVSGDILIIKGPEKISPTTTITRQIIGGTGEFANATGVLLQEFLGFTDFGGSSITFTLDQIEESDAPSNLSATLIQ